MKTTVPNHHKNSVINYLFFGIVASVLTLSIFFSFYQKEEKVNFITDIAYITNSRMLKPISTIITETQPVNLKTMLTKTSEVPIVMEPWITKTITSGSTVTLSVASSSTYYEAEILVEQWMTDIDSWALVSSNTVLYAETEMAIESWMLNTDEWLVLSDVSPYLTNNITEEPLQIENWMLNLDSWSITFNDVNFFEPQLTLESWMLNSSSWLASSK